MKWFQKKPKLLSPEEWIQNKKDSDLSALNEVLDFCRSQGPKGKYTFKCPDHKIFGELKHTAFMNYSQQYHPGPDSNSFHCCGCFIVFEQPDIWNSPAQEHKVYFYKALTENGTEKKGQVIASNSEEAISKIKHMGLVPTSIADEKYLQSIDQVDTGDIYEGLQKILKLQAEIEKPIYIAPKPRSEGVELEIE